MRLQYLIAAISQPLQLAPSYQLEGHEALTIVFPDLFIKSNRQMIAPPVQVDAPSLMFLPSCLRSQQLALGLVIRLSACSTLLLNFYEARGAAYASVIHRCML